MPIYTYTCYNCNKEFDKLVLDIKNKQNEVVCPHCTGLAKRKEIYSAGCNGQYLVWNRVGAGS